MPGCCLGHDYGQILRIVLEVSLMSAVLANGITAGVVLLRVAGDAALLRRKINTMELNSISLRNYYSVYSAAELCGGSRTRAVDRRGIGKRLTTKGPVVVRCLSESPRKLADVSTI